MFEIETKNLKISDELHIPLPKGASKEVDKIDMELKEKNQEEIEIIDQIK